MISDIIDNLAKLPAMPTLLCVSENLYNKICEECETLDYWRKSIYRKTKSNTVSYR